jgi:hypothetical protein
MMAWFRSPTCSLLKIAATWLATVFGAIDIRRAISVLRTPAAMSSSTSRSRLVKPGNGVLWAGAGAETRPSTRRAIPGPKMASPAATAWMARTISSC